MKGLAKSAIAVLVVVAGLVYTWETQPLVLGAGKIRVGMTHEQAVNAVGKRPEWERTGYEWCKQWVEVCQRARASASETFLLFKGLNSLLVVGVDGGGFVRFHDVVML